VADADRAFTTYDSIVSVFRVAADRCALNDALRSAIAYLIPAIT